MLLFFSVQEPVHGQSTTDSSLCVVRTDRTAPASPASAERATVLQQIALPHNYYYREMYLPQLTNGPSSVAWSPDGSKLVYSMQGSLWGQALDSTNARQVTAGPGYDYQPDWSPDGTLSCLPVYRHDAMELRLLDLDSGKVRRADRERRSQPRAALVARRCAIACVSTACRAVAYLRARCRAGHPSATDCASPRNATAACRATTTATSTIPLAGLVTRWHRADLRLAIAGTSRAPAGYGDASRSRRHRRYVWSATRRPPGRPGPTGRATASASSTRPTSGASGTSSG